MFFLYFSEVNQPLVDTAVGTRLWLWGKCILGKLTHFACFWIGSPCFKCLCCKTSVQHSNRASKKKLQHFLALFQQFNIVLNLSSFCELCLCGCWGACFLLCFAFCLCFLPVLEKAAISTGGSGNPGTLSTQYLSLLVTLGYWSCSPLSVQGFVEPGPMRSQK